MRQHSIHSKGPKQPARTPAHPVAPITFTHATAAENPQLETWGGQRLHCPTFRLAHAAAYTVKRYSVHWSQSWKKP